MGSCSLGPEEDEEKELEELRAGAYRAKSVGGEQTVTVTKSLQMFRFVRAHQSWYGGDRLMLASPVSRQSRTAGASSLQHSR